MLYLNMILLKFFKTKISPYNKNIKIKYLPHLATLDTNKIRDSLNEKQHKFCTKFCRPIHPNKYCLYRQLHHIHHTRYSPMCLMNVFPSEMEAPIESHTVLAVCVVYACEQSTGNAFDVIASIYVAPSRYCDTVAFVHPTLHSINVLPFWRYAHFHAVKVSHSRDL